MSAPRRQKAQWTPEQLDLLIRCYPVMSAAEIAQQLPHSMSAIYTKAAALGLKKSREWIAQRARETGQRNPWTQEHVALLERLFPELSAAEIATRLPHSERSIYQKARALGLKKSAAWIAERARQRALDPAHGGAATRFQKGLQPWNSGTKGVMKRNSGSFQPGTVPQTWRPIGSDRVTPDGYLARKTADTGVTRRDYVPVHHLIWRMHGRSVPAGHALIFRDGDRRNFDINNLELLTRPELMKRNTVHRHGPEIAQLSQLMGAIKRRINRKEKEARHGQ